MTFTKYGRHNLGLFELGPSAEWKKEHGEPTLDVVAVHGLNGECFRTWTHEEPTGEKTVWLRDLLFQKLPRTRTMTFGYNASVVNNTSTMGIRENARKLLSQLRDRRELNGSCRCPIVFVGHSLGGIIIKHALRIADNDPKQYGHIADSTKGIVFFATPHRGSDMATWGQMVAGITSVSFGSRLKQPFFGVLRRNSKDLIDLSEDFRPIAEKYALQSFVEENIYPKLGRVIVERHSAIMEVPHESYTWISGDHSTMCKFSRDPSDACRFDAVWQSIQRVAKGTNSQRAAFNIVDMYNQNYPVAGIYAFARPGMPMMEGRAQGQARPGMGMIEGPVPDQEKSPWQPVAFSSRRV